MASQRFASQEAGSTPYPPYYAAQAAYAAAPGHQTDTAVATAPGYAYGTGYSTGTGTGYDESICHPGSGGGFGDYPGHLQQAAPYPGPAQDFPHHPEHHAPEPPVAHEPVLPEPAAPEPSSSPLPDYYGPAPDGQETREEWNPNAETLAAANRGRHRVARQRGGTIARSRAVLGVGVIAAVGAGGMASAQEDGAPGMGAAAEKVKQIPGNIPGLGALFGNDDRGPGGADAGFPVITAAPLTAEGTALQTSADTASAASSGTGEALRARLLQQAEQQEAAAEAEERDAAADAALTEAEAEAAALAEQRRLEEEERQRLEEERRRKEEEERLRREEEERLRRLRESYTAPLSSYTISAQYGQAGSMWASGYHTGTDFSAPAGTPVKNVHTGVVLEAAWNGSYGYQVVIELADGTEISYSHLSSMAVVAGQEVITGDVIGNVGSTGNSTGPHLHLEVRPGGGDTIDPLPWLRENGVAI
ncbi:M23 family metallopeptidase [Streptomyces aidingensis]|uniref:Peptidase family M23 n=1 Tax=Streptomyces aidingensis TaxID=910347 RepID=A0A1I1TUN9_9ACTN|nr:M23 family metallopeptidase [Streptomyces aidingensis]SFD62224.1 Peptidase family M23 [Streptomyces aidingensis]